MIKIFTLELGQSNFVITQHTSLKFIVEYWYEILYNTIDKQVLSRRNCSA